MTGLKIGLAIAGQLGCADAEYEETNDAAQQPGDMTCPAFVGEIDVQPPLFMLTVHTIVFLRAVRAVRL